MPIEKPSSPVKYRVDSLPFPRLYSRASTWYRAISTNYPVVIALPIMKDTRLHKYYRASGYGLNSLIYRFLITDYHLRHFFNLNAYCGAVTFVTFIFAAIIAVCSIASLNTVTSNGALFRELFKKAEKLQRMSVFQEKTKKMLCKEQLELEIMNSKMSCIEKLLKPEEQSGWRRSRSPKVYHRPINAEVSK